MMFKLKIQHQSAHNFIFYAYLCGVKDDFMLKIYLATTV